MAAQESRWLTYLLADLGEPPRSPPVLYVDNKAMLALCREHRLEHRTKHIALRYFLARELQKRGQLRLAYVASEANTTDIFTKALPPGDHQRFCTMLDCVPHQMRPISSATGKCTAAPACCCTRAALPSRAALPNRPALPSRAATAAAPATMANPNVLTFYAEGRAVNFEVWVDHLQIFLLCDSKDGLSLFDLTSGASTAPAADADSTVRSQWTTRDAAARLAVRIARYSSPTTAALSRLMLPYLFPYLVAFATVADLLTHLRTSDTRYRTALPADFCAKNPPPPSEKSIVAVGASRGFGGGDGGGGAGGGGGGGGGAGRGGAVQRGDFGGGQRKQQQRSRETPSP
ncbi:unnamed protein product [Closterium sp. NIES-54]